MIRTLPRFIFVLGALLIASLSGCGGGSSDMAPPTSAQRATVGILLTDAPSDTFSEINATITSVDLLGSGGPQNVFSGSRTVDLLSLDGTSDLFALANDVVPGTFNKIRLTLSKLELVRRD